VTPFIVTVKNLAELIALTGWTRRRFGSNYSQCTESMEPSFRTRFATRIPGSHEVPVRDSPNAASSVQWFPAGGFRRCTWFGL